MRKTEVRGKLQDMEYVADEKDRMTTVWEGMNTVFNGKSWIGCSSGPRYLRNGAIAWTRAAGRSI